MRRLILLLMLFAAVFAQCDEALTTLETDYASYMHITSVDCDHPNAESLYATLAEIAESYAYVAQCYREDNDLAKSYAYYTVAGEKYLAAADALCTTDYSLKMNLYISSGDSYAGAKQTEAARASYEKASVVYRVHNEEIDSALYALVNNKIYKLDHPLAEDVQDVTSEEEVDWVPFAVAALVVIGILITLISLRIKK